VGRFLEIVAVHEDVFLSTVPVQVAIQHDFPLFFKLTNQSFNSKILGVKRFE